MKRSRSVIYISIILVLALISLAAPALTGAVRLAQGAPLQQDATAGEAIFQQKCVGCHTIGGGTLVGPDLKGVTERRDLTWLKNFIADPPGVIASGDPIATKLLADFKNFKMPKLNLSPADIDNVLAYLQIAQTTPKPTPGPAIPSGNSIQGKAYFTGARSLMNGAPACMSCHSVQSVAALGGGSLGPDLTQVVDRLSATGLASFLQAPPTSIMTSVFRNRPLTSSERADLQAFFAASAGQSIQPATAVAFLFLGIGAAGAALLFGLMMFFWPRQRVSISAELRRKT